GLARWPKLCDSARRTPGSDQHSSGGAGLPISLPRLAGIRPGRQVASGVGGHGWTGRNGRKAKKGENLSYILGSCEFERTPTMTSHRFIADDHPTCPTSAGLHQIDLAWQKKYPQFLDNGREPRPLSGRSLLFI